MREQDSNPGLPAFQGHTTFSPPRPRGEGGRDRGAQEQWNGPWGLALLPFGKKNLVCGLQLRGEISSSGLEKSGLGLQSANPCALSCQPCLITTLCVLTEKLYLPLGIDVKINACLANYSFPVTSCSWERRSLGNRK